jgi:O-acetyl-ADP-ribose deacetylase (regulator of RNase III)
MIRYHVGDATNPLGAGPRVIAHLCNDAGKWGSGFVLAVSRRWPHVRAAYLAWSRAREPETPFALGEVQVVLAETGIWVANIIGQHGLIGPTNPSPIDYDAVERGLCTVGAFAREQGAILHMPRIGTRRAGGSWKRILPLIVAATDGIEVNVYDWPARPVPLSPPRG